MIKIIFLMILTSAQIKASCLNISGDYKVLCSVIHLETANAGGTMLSAYYQDDVIHIAQENCHPQINGEKLFQYTPVMNKKEQKHFQQEFFVLEDGFTQINRHGAYADFEWDMGNPYDLSRLSYLLDLVNPKKWIPQKIKVPAKIELKSIVQNDHGDLRYLFERLNGQKELVTKKECFFKKL